MTMNVLEGADHRNALARARSSFRHWRKGRPFLGGLLTILSGVELWWAPASPIGVIIHEGIAGISAFFIGALMVVMGLAVWFAPAYRVFAGIATILLGLIALPATNLGGFVVGTVLALTGGSLAVAWTPRPGWSAPTWREKRSTRTAAGTAVEGEVVESTAARPADDYETAEIVPDGPAALEAPYPGPSSTSILTGTADEAEGHPAEHADGE